MVVGGFALSGLLGSGRASMLPLGTLSLNLWVIAVDPAFIAGHQSIKNCGIWTDQLDHLPAVMITSLFLLFSEHPWDNLLANLPHLQFLANDCMYSSHTDIKLYTYCPYRHTTVLIHEILYLSNQLWCSDFLTPPKPLIIPHRLPSFFESLMLQQELEYTLLKPDCHSWWILKMQSGFEDTLEEQYAIKFCFKLGKMPQKRMEYFRLLLDHLAWIEHQFLRGIRYSRKAGSLWAMMRGVGGVRKSIDQSWLDKGFKLGLGLLYWGFKGVQEEITSEEASTLQIGSVAKTMH